MPAASQPELEPGRVYRTREFALWGANPTRLAQRLVRAGSLVRLCQGIYVHPETSRFGRVPPADEEVVRAFLDGGPFVFTGPERWNALGLGTTAVFALPIIYNTKRSGVFSFGGRRMLFKRVAFPVKPTTAWFVVDLFEHSDEAGVDRGALTERLTRLVAQGKIDRGELSKAAQRYGSRQTQTLVGQAILAAT